MSQTLSSSLVDFDFQRQFVELITTYVVLCLFGVMAVYFVLVVVGLAKPDRTTRIFLFTLFSATSLGILYGGVKDFLRLDIPATIAEIKTSSERAIAVQVSQGEPAADAKPASAGNGTQAQPRAPITIFAQVGSSADKAQFTALKSTLNGMNYLLPGVEVMNAPIPANTIKYCDPANAGDAAQLKTLLEAKHFNPFTIVQIPAAQCTKQVSKNILEVWLQSSS